MRTVHPTPLLSPHTYLHGDRVGRLVRCGLINDTQWHCAPAACSRFHPLRLRASRMAGRQASRQEMWVGSTASQSAIVCFLTSSTDEQAKEHPQPCRLHKSSSCARFGS